MPERKPINQMQIKMIKIAQKQLGLSDDAYRLILNQRYWVNSCKDLSYDEAHDLIFNYFVPKGFKIISRRYEKKKIKAPNIIQLVSKQQLSKIEHLRADIKWHVHDGFYRWIRKYLKRPSPSPQSPPLKGGEGPGSEISFNNSPPLEGGVRGGGIISLIHTAREANSVIEGLKGMLKRQQTVIRDRNPSPVSNTDMDTADGHGLRRDGGMHGGYHKW